MPIPTNLFQENNTVVVFSLEFLLKVTWLHFLSQFCLS